MDRLNRKRKKTNKISIQSQKPNVFLSHTWKKDLLLRDTHKRVKNLNNLLKKTNIIDTWFDEEKIEGHIIQAISQGIDDCDVVIICITREYINKCNSPHNDNCKLELDYSFERKGVNNLIPLVLEPDCLETSSWNGTLGAYLNKCKYLTFIDESIQEITDLVSEIKRISNRQHV